MRDAQGFATPDRIVMHRPSIGPVLLVAVALAEKNGSKTRAILKEGDRGAIVLSVAVFDLGTWTLGALVFAFACVSSRNSATGRTALRAIRYRQCRRLECYAAITGRDQTMSVQTILGMRNRLPRAPCNIIILSRRDARPLRYGAFPHCPCGIEPIGCPQQPENGWASEK